MLQANGETDYYELETHIFFDDAFCAPPKKAAANQGTPRPPPDEKNKKNETNPDKIVNAYVKDMIDCIVEASEAVHKRPHNPQITKIATPVSP